VGAITPTAAVEDRDRDLLTWSLCSTPNAPLWWALSPTRRCSAGAAKRRQTPLSWAWATSRLGLDPGSVWGWMRRCWLVGQVADSRWIWVSNRRINRWADPYSDPAACAITACVGRRTESTCALLLLFGIIAQLAHFLCGGHQLVGLALGPIHSWPGTEPRIAGAGWAHSAPTHLLLNYAIY